MKKLWVNKEYKLDSSIIISDIIVNKYIDIFWNDIMNKLDNKQYILLLFRIKFINSNYSTIGELQKINKNSKKDLVKYLKNIINISFDAYKDIPISSIIFSYGIRKGDIKVPSNNTAIKIKYHTYYNNKLPVTIIPEEYGKIISKSGNIYFILSDSATIILEQSEDKTINSVKYIKDLKVLFSWVDTIISLDNKKFTRKIGKSTYHYENGDLVLYTIAKKTKAMSNNILPKNNKQNRKFLTMDLETILVNNIHVPYLLCWFDGKESKYYFIKFKLNITKYPTLPSLAFKLFRTHYLKKDTIHMISGKIDDNIRQGYTGGAVDMYIPSNFNNKLIYCYDVNSLYPYVMANFKMPIGSPTYFQKDIRKFNPYAFGFFYCKITAPENLLHPILQVHHLGKDNLRTIAPIGTWEGMYFSEELYNAEKLGYKFEVLWGYTFESDLIFKDYINDLYKIRLEYPKSDPINLVAKLLLNSLYGRFGMNDNFTYIDIWQKDEYLRLEKDNLDNIINIIKLGNNYLVQLKFKQKELDTNLDNASETHNINIAIAFAVAAYARIHMSQFKNNPNLPNLYYSDTDSAYFDGPLPDSMVDPKRLGAIKLEKICKKAIFLAPKVYAFLDQNNIIEIKIKGVTKKAIIDNNININLFESLLFKNKFIELKQTKWFKSLADANITINEQLYSLKATENKRELVYDYNNKLVATKALRLKNGIIEYNN